MKNVKRIKSVISFIIIIIVLCIAFCFSSCAEKTSNSSIDDIFSQLVISDSETETQIPAFTDHIYVIIPDDCSGELSIKARELADKIEEKVEILTSLKYDNELTVVPKNSCEILIGNTNILASENAFDILKMNEYVCHWDDGTIVICGRNDENTLIAIDRFINEILPLSTKYSLMHGDAGFELTFDYAVRSVKLNGYDLYDYVLTYAKSNENREEEIAFMLRDFINLKSGYLLEVVADNEMKSADARVISLVGEGEENSLISSEKGISLLGTDSYMLSLAVAKFINDFESNIKDDAVELNYYEKIEIEEVNASFKMSITFLKDNDLEPFKPIYNLISLMQSQDMGFCLVGNIDDAIREDLVLNVKSNIKMQEILIGEREIMIAYNEQNTRKIDISVDESTGVIVVNVETLFGEMFCATYVVNGEYSIDGELLKNNSFVFCENPINVEYQETTSIQAGIFNIAESEMSYLYTQGENVYISNLQDAVSDDENGFSCVIDNKLIYSKELLNYTLK